jgi:hypothetical protein
MTFRLAVFGTLVLAVVFFLVTAPVKEAPFLFDRAPWLSDPFDPVISFMILLVPLIAVLVHAAAAPAGSATCCGAAGCCWRDLAVEECDDLG